MFVLPGILSERAQGAARPGRTSISLISIRILRRVRAVMRNGRALSGVQWGVWRATYLVRPGVSRSLCSLCVLPQRLSTVLKTGRARCGKK